MIKTCKVCKGRGEISSSEIIKNCQHCDGLGFLKAEEEKPESYNDYANAIQSTRTEKGPRSVREDKVFENLRQSGIKWSI